MRWTVTIKDETYGTGSEILAYSFRVTRTGGTVRLSVQNSARALLRRPAQTAWFLAANRISRRDAAAKHRMQLGTA